MVKPNLLIKAIIKPPAGSSAPPAIGNAIHPDERPTRTGSAEPAPIKRTLMHDMRVIFIGILAG
jgi:hypothetical protein